MTPQEVLELAAHPDVPKFIFGTEALEAWTREHRDSRTGECIKSSGLYLVIHRSLNPSQRPDFRVLSAWCYGDRVPRSWDVPQVLT